MTETTTAAPGRRRPMLIAAAAAAAALLVGGLALVATGDDDGPPRLDLSAASPGAAGQGGDRVAESADLASDDVAGMSMMVPTSYTAAEELPDLGGTAPVYRLAGDDDDLRSIAEHLGLAGDVTQGEGVQRTISDGAASVNGHGASWWYTSGQPYPGSEDVPPDAGVSTCTPEGVCEEPAPLPEPERPADLPTQAEAEAIVRGLAEAAGVDLTGATVTSYDNIVTWSVNIDLALDGTPLPGWSVYGTVMEGGQVLDAGGALGQLERVGDYPLDTTRTAIDRLNEQSTSPAALEPALEEAPVEDAPVADAPVEEAPVEEAPVEEAPVDAAVQTDPGEMTILPVEGDGEPISVTLRSAELSYTLVGNADGSETYLVPAYLLDGEDDRGQEWLDVFAIAVRAEFLAG